MKTEFTIEEIKNYILAQDSLGDVLYNLKAEKIIEANEPNYCECGAIISKNNSLCGDCCEE
jgi:hypothetical protein